MAGSEAAVTIHPSAVVEPGAVVGAGSVVDAHAYLGAHVEIGADCWVGPHAVLTGRVRAGDRNRFFPFSSVGAESQDLWRPETENWVWIGNDNVVRENVTINAGTAKEFRCTSIGDGNNIMAGTHIAHDCVIGDRVVIANNVLLGGHVRIRDDANLGGGAAVHHFVTIGRRAFVGGLSRVIHDVPPWMLLEGHPARVRGVNVVGARRHGVSDEDLQALREIFKRLFRNDGEERRTDTRRRIREEAAPPPVVVEVLEALERQSAGHRGRHLEAYRREDRTVDTSKLHPDDHPRMIP